MNPTVSMNARRFGYILAWALAAAPVRAQLTPRVGYVYPAGGRQGTTVVVAVGGQWLSDPERVTVTGEGVEAQIVEYIEPDWRKLQRLRTLLDRHEAKQQEAGTDSAATELRQLRKEIRRITRRIADPKTQVPPQIGDTVRVKLTIAGDAAPDQREIRVVTSAGASNPLIFHVGRLSEIAEGATSAPPPELPVVLNGQILPGEVDRFQIPARRGQRIVFAVNARGLMPYLADAVPGWFQAVVTLHDADGAEVAYVDDYQFNPDPVLFYEIPADGDYTLAIRDAIYRGRQDFVYRITVGELPFVTGIFPLGGPVGETTTVAVDGWDLPTGRVNVSAPGGKPGVRPLAVMADGVASNSVPFATDDLSETLEAEPNNDAPSAQSATLPVIVNGRIDSPGDWDVFVFQGRAGRQVVAEIHARRLNSPLDAVLKLTDHQGRVLAANDDREDIAAGLTTHHADPYLSVVLPSDGLYVLRVGDVQGHGSSRHAYRLRIGPPRPDFAVRIVPSSVHVPRGGSAPVTVHVLRHDGFTGGIELALADNSEGLSLSGVVPAGEDSACLTLSAQRYAPMGPSAPRLIASAVIDGKTIRHDAVPAEDMMQAFLYRHLVPVQEFAVTVGKPAKVSIRAVEPDGGVLRIPAGGSAKIVIRSNRRARRANAQIKFALSGAPDGITLVDGTIPVGRRDFPLVISADAEQVQVGQRGNLVVCLVGGKQRQFRICCAPAIPFVIVK